MKREQKSHSRRVNARRVARLRARYLGAIKRVSTLKKRINEITNIVNNRSVLRLVDGVSQRVKLSKPELDDYRVRRNDLLSELVIARQELKDFKADYSEAVTTNKEASKVQLGKNRKSLLKKAAEGILDQFKKILSKAAEEGREDQIIALQQTANNSMSEAQFKKFVKQQTGVYIPKYADLSKVRDVLVQWKIDVKVEDKVHVKDEVPA